MAPLGEALRDTEYGEGTGSILLDEVDCLGSEQRLEQCLSNSWGDNDCWHFEDAGVKCCE